MVFILYSLAMLPTLSPSPPLPFPLALLSPCPLFVVGGKCIRTQRRQGYSQGNRQGFWSYSQGNRLLLVSLKNPLALDGLWSDIFRETGYKSFVYLGFLLRLPGKRAVVSLFGNSSSMGLLVQCSVLHEKILFDLKRRRRARFQHYAELAAWRHGHCCTFSWNIGCWASWEYGLIKAGSNTICWWFSDDCQPLCPPPCWPRCPPSCRQRCPPPCRPPQCHLDAFWGLRDADRMEIQKSATDRPTNLFTNWPG